MKHTIAILILIFIGIHCSYAQGSNKKEYYIVFCGKRADADSKAGHAFISYGKGSPFTCNADGPVTEAWGLYATTGGENCIPSHTAAGKSYFIGSVPGCLVSDVFTSVDNYFELRLEYNKYLKVVAEVNKWKRKNYELKQQDCLTFVIEIASLFYDQLAIPQRSGFENFPYLYVKKLIGENR